MQKSYYWYNFTGIIGWLNYSYIVPWYFWMIIIVFAHAFHLKKITRNILYFWFFAILTILIAHLTHYTLGLAYNILLGIPLIAITYSEKH